MYISNQNLIKIIFFLLISLLFKINCQDTTQIHSSREIYKINSYKNVQILRFWIPSNTLLATWSFWANTSLNCDSVDVKIYFKWKGLPILKFDKLIENDVVLDDEQIKLEFKANGNEFIYNLTNPLAGEWFVLAYFEKNKNCTDLEEKVFDKILTKTVLFDCRSWLSSILVLKKVKNIVKLHLNNYYKVIINESKLFTFRLPQNIINFNLNISECKKIENKFVNNINELKCPLIIYFRSSGLPSKEINDKVIQCKNRNDFNSLCYHQFFDLVPNDFNYILIQIDKNSSNYFNQFQIYFTLNYKECYEYENVNDYLNRELLTSFSSEIYKNYNQYNNKEDLFQSSKRASSNKSKLNLNNEKLNLNSNSNLISIKISTLSATETKVTTNKIPTTTINKFLTTKKNLTTTPLTIKKFLTTKIPLTTKTLLTTTSSLKTLTPLKKIEYSTNTTFSTSTSTIITSTHSKSISNTTDKTEKETKKLFYYTSNPNTFVTKTLSDSIFKNDDKILEILPAESNKIINIVKINKKKNLISQTNSSFENKDYKKDLIDRNFKNNSYNKQPNIIFKSDKEFFKEDTTIESDYNEDDNDDEKNDEDEDVVSEDNQDEFNNFDLNNHNHGYNLKNEFNSKYYNKINKNQRKNERNSYFNRNHKYQLNLKDTTNENDDDLEINNFTKERANRFAHNFDFTRRNNSRNRIERAINILNTKLNYLKLTDQCPFYLHLSRYNLPGKFFFKYDRIQLNSPKVLNFIKVPNSNNHLYGKINHLSLVQFEVIPLLDSGNNLEIDLNLNVDFDTNVNNVSIIACVKHNKIAFSLNNCLNKIQVNSSNLKLDTFSKILIPFPRSGQWFISIIAFCYHKISLPLSNNYLNKSHFNEFEQIDCVHNTSTIILNIKSETCNDNNCPSKRGKCQTQLQNSLLYSFCECRMGYYGFKCSESTNNYKEDVQKQFLTELLVFTFTNLLWLPVIIISAYKYFWVESIIYFLTMKFSIFYNICISTSFYSTCILNSYTLEFCCLFVTCLCICITLTSLCDFGLTMKYILHMFSTVWVAFLVQMNWTPFWMYICSTILFSLILFTSWLINCCHGTCYPSCKLWFFSITPSITILFGAFTILLYPILIPKWIIDCSFNMMLPISVLFLIFSFKNNSRMIVRDANNLSPKGVRSKDRQPVGKGISTETYYELIAEEASHLARHPLN